MSLSPKKWSELKEGWGLEEVPKNLQEEIGCCLCGTFTKGKLYSDGVGRYLHANTQRECQIAVDMMRQNSYCRYHAEQMFGGN